MTILMVGMQNSLLVLESLKIGWKLLVLESSKIGWNSRNIRNHLRKKFL
jgi:hypothetical protein